jgi:protocatechuate 3,4-dioxygenase beta subunit
MEITRRQALVRASVAPIVASKALSALAGQVADAQAATDAQFTPPPSAPTDEELQLLASAVESARRMSATQLVQDARFLPLHAQPIFRQLVKAIARDSVLTIPRDEEPGTRIVVAGSIVGPSGRPVAGAVAYVYHTSAKGWYSDKAAHIRSWAGDARHSRLFGYLKTGQDGSFEVRTIRPGGYPRSMLAQHIHLEVEANAYVPLATELLFDDDPRLTAEQRDHAKREAFFIAAQSPGLQNKPTYRYRVTLEKA